MSNNSNTDEIDEVMSSVRRLVLNNDRTDTETKATDASKSVQPPERFVLTPALRVGDDDEAAADVEATPPQPADNVLHLDPSARADGLGGLEATLAELEAAVTKQPEDWEADEGEPLNTTDWAVSAFATPEATSFFEPATPADQIADDAPIQAATSGDDEVFNADGTFQPDDELKAFFPKHDGEIDQAALRELIVEIVHEELTGEVGERITRNVRKLVRREINQMLAARKLT